MQDRFSTVPFAAAASFDDVQDKFQRNLKSAYPIKNNGISISAVILSSHLNTGKTSALARCAVKLNYHWQSVHQVGGSHVTAFYLCCFDKKHQKYFFCEQPQQRFDGHRVYRGLLSLNGQASPTSQTWTTLKEFSNHPAQNHAVLTDREITLATNLNPTEVHENSSWFFYFEGHYVESVKDFS